MALSARLDLRMQKELKLLATDPPPGVSIPSLCNHSGSDDSHCLHTIDARIEGPEGTVYEKGVFNIKIQIPDRYPFQPPNVTFSTPIYHPNIDNGGRICLDILNLPPKGAWQPSLNISTVLASIGLLLSEPNPDDGLMCEASREYKYNRQAFDQKARSWTEKYAKAGAVEGSSSRGLLDISNMVEAEGVDVRCGTAVDETMNSQKKQGINRKLSLETSVSVKRKSSDNKENAIQKDTKENIGPIRRLSLSLTQRQFAESSKPIKLSRSGNSDDEPPLLQEYAGKTINAIVEQKRQVSAINGKDSVNLARPVSLLQARCCDAQPHSPPGCAGKGANALVNQKAQTVDYPARYADSVKSLPLPQAGSCDEQSNSLDCCRKPMHAINEQTKLVPDIPATVVVSDSEGSDEELERPARTRLSLGRTRLMGRWIS